MVINSAGEIQIRIVRVREFPLSTRVYFADGNFGREFIGPGQMDRVDAILQFCVINSIPVTSVAWGNPDPEPGGFRIQMRFTAAPAIVRNPAARSMACDGCDGRGWYELFTTGRTNCEKCGGVGFLLIKPITASGGSSMDLGQVEASLE